MQQLDIFFSSFEAFWRSFATFMPKLIAALVLLFIGWLIAKVVRTATGHFLKLVHFDGIAEKSGIEAFLKQGGFSISLSRMLGELAYWLILMIVVVTVSNSLGLQMVSDLFNKVVLYIPNIIVAILVLVFGTLLSRLVNRVIFAYLNNMGVEGALGISTMAEYAIQIFVVFVALEQLQIGVALLTAAFQIGFGAICFALALAFGLGGKDWAAGVIQRMSERKNKKQ